jgi:hypothetical protein
MPLHSRILLVNFRRGYGRLPIIAANGGRSRAHNEVIRAGANSTRLGLLFLAYIEAGRMPRSSALHYSKCIQVSLKAGTIHIRDSIARENDAVEVPTTSNSHPVFVRCETALNMPSWMKAWYYIEWLE